MNCYNFFLSFFLSFFSMYNNFEFSHPIHRCCIYLKVCVILIRLFLRLNNLPIIIIYVAYASEEHVELEVQRAQSNFTMTNVMEQSAHEIRDMLLGCNWRSAEDCDYHNFSLTVTDLGVCYTFNNPPNKGDVLRVNQAGSRYGLYMMLNVEQHEYTLQQHPGAGFKV